MCDSGSVPLVCVFCDGRIEAGDGCDGAWADKQGSHSPYSPAVIVQHWKAIHSTKFSDKQNLLTQSGNMSQQKADWLQIFAALWFVNLKTNFVLPGVNVYYNSSAVKKFWYEALQE